MTILIRTHDKFARDYPDITAGKIYRAEEFNEAGFVHFKDDNGDTQFAYINTVDWEIVTDAESWQITALRDVYQWIDDCGAQAGTDAIMKKLETVIEDLK